MCIIHVNFYTIPLIVLRMGVAACFEKMASALWTVSLPAHHRVALVSLLLSLGLLSSQAQGAFPCVTTLLTSDVFGRCTNISLAALKSAPAALFGHEVSQYTQL